MSTTSYYGRKTEVDPILDKIKNYEGVKGYALISRDGITEKSELPSGLHGETFSIMIATIYGAAITTQDELKKDRLNYIRLESDEGPTIITGAGNSILAVNLNKDAKQTLEKVLAAAKEISEIIPTL